MGRKVLFLLALGLAACAAGGGGDGAFRTASAPIWSAAAFDLGRIAGDWRQVGGFADRAGGCSGGAVRFQPAGAGVQMTGRLCLNGRVQGFGAALRDAGPGRFMVGDQEWWVLWVDSGYRTLAIGTPSGGFGVLLDRGMISPDRFQAAREVFDFNGYDTARLRAF